MKAIAKSVARDKGQLITDKKLTDGWFRRFMARQPHLSSRKGDPTGLERVQCVCQRWFHEECIAM